MDDMIENLNRKLVSSSICVNDLFLGELQEACELSDCNVGKDMFIRDRTNVAFNASCEIRMLPAEWYRSSVYNAAA